MLQSGALSAEDMRWLWGLHNVWETVIVCSNSSKTLALVTRQHVISYARPLLCRGMTYLYHVNGRKILAFRKK
jgi:hypothetical protein